MCYAIHLKILHLKIPTQEKGTLLKAGAELSNQIKSLPDGDEFPPRKAHLTGTFSPGLIVIAQIKHSSTTLA